MAECIRQLLAGKISCDHLIEEFKYSRDSDVRAIVKLIEKATEGLDLYERVERGESEFVETMEGFIKRLEAGTT